MSASHANYIHISFADIGLAVRDDDEDYEEDIACYRLTAVIKKHNIPAKRGDLIGLSADEERYRNQDCFMWDGEKAICLFHNIDEYGSVPRSIMVTDTEFHPHYWEEVVAHNTMFWLAQPILDRFRVSWDSKLRLHIASTTIGGKPYTVLIEPRSEDELQAALDGEPVEPCETAAEIEANIRAGKYYFETNHSDLEYIDLDVKPERLFYALPRTEYEMEGTAAEDAEAAAVDSEAELEYNEDTAFDKEWEAAAEPVKVCTRLERSGGAITLDELLKFLQEVKRYHVKGGDLKIKHVEFGSLTKTNIVEVKKDYIVFE